jgi:hypothetical protein
VAVSNGRQPQGLKYLQWMIWEGDFASVMDSNLAALASVEHRTE